MASSISEFRRAQIREKAAEIMALTEEIARITAYGEQLSREASQSLTSSSSAAQERRGVKSGLSIQERMNLQRQQLGSAEVALEKLEEEYDGLSAT
ncbi:MAG: Glucose-repressible alcohol dehydrogenase transcriptional effector [Chaenotheca gracillima]|nr:MAG: Glucose-repressible alcohol dehydrogenase transcriptional effector [Chaenotheca gracillima]